MNHDPERAVTLRDLHVGQVFETASTVIGHDAIVAFAALICAVMMLWWFLIGRHNQPQR